MTLVDLVQPRHNYAPSVSESSIGHVYLPSSLLTVGARLLGAGIDITVHDENIRPYKQTSDLVGITLVGAPYIPEVIDLQYVIIERSGKKTTFLLGGQVITGLTPPQFKRLFGASSHNGNEDMLLARTFDINVSDLTPPENTSLIPAYERIDDTTMREYLSQEFSLYTSQGCRFSCDFCAAVKTTPEQYRELDIVEKDLDYLARKAVRFGIGTLNVYLSNLDVFQTPNKLLEFARIAKRTQQSHPSVKMKMRGLATVHQFLEARGQNRACIEELIEAGFDTVGFGVDGMTPQVWKAMKKGHNTKEKCVEAIQSARHEFGITPEVLMVFGHNDKDTENTLCLAYEFTRDMADLHGAVPRPYIAKAFVPGNDGWRSGRYAAEIEILLTYPELFQQLEYGALPTELTHPDAKLRALATKYFLDVCGIPGNATAHIKPLLMGMTELEKEEVRKFNEGRWDH
ncbi:radical SAM protein [Candidatus Woesearchaeota archaeon]|nr:radical SAM protein [Candidatus Woesearchaeota archaeon]